MKKLWMLIALLICSAVLLTGCASNADTLASPTPGAATMQPMVSPMPTNGMDVLPDLVPGLMPSASPSESAAPSLGAGGVNNLADARRVSEMLEDALDKLSEVDDAYAVVTGSTALIGLEFNSQYQGGVDERLQQMVLTRAQTVDKAITGVAVTQDAAILQQIEALSDSLEEATSLSAVATQAEELISQIGVYRE